MSTTFLLPHLIALARKLHREHDLLEARETFLGDPPVVSYATASGEILTRLSSFSGIRVVDVSKKLLTAVSDCTGFAISVFQADVLSDDSMPYSYIIYGKDKNGGKVAHIRVSSCNLCWTRFAVAKELMHLLLLSEEMSEIVDQSGIGELVRNARKARTERGAITENTPIIDEQAAEVLALEVMLPFDLREKQYDPFVNNDESSHLIAHINLIPERCIDDFRADNYHALSFQYNMRS